MKLFSKGIDAKTILAFQAILYCIYLYYHSQGGDVTEVLEAKSIQAQPNISHIRPANVSRSGADPDESVVSVIDSPPSSRLSSHFMNSKLGRWMKGKFGRTATSTRFVPATQRNKTIRCLVWDHPHIVSPEQRRGCINGDLFFPRTKKDLALAQGHVFGDSILIEPEHYTGKYIQKIDGVEGRMHRTSFPNAVRYKIHTKPSPAVPGYVYMRFIDSGFVIRMNIFDRVPVWCVRFAAPKLLSRAMDDPNKTTSRCEDMFDQKQMANLTAYANHTRIDFGELEVMVDSGRVYVIDLSTTPHGEYKGFGMPENILVRSMQKLFGRSTEKRAEESSVGSDFQMKVANGGGQQLVKAQKVQANSSDMGEGGAPKVLPAASGLKGGVQSAG